MYSLLVYGISTLRQRRLILAASGKVACTMACYLALVRYIIVLSVL